MKNEVFLRNLASGKEKNFSLPMEEKSLEEMLACFGTEYILVDSSGFFPVESEFPDIREINLSLLSLEEYQKDNGIGDIEIATLFAASRLPAKETVNRIIEGEYSLYDLDAETAGWNGSDETKAAIFLSRLFPLEAFRKAFKKNNGIYPDELEDYIDWDRVWNEYSLSEGFMLVKHASDSYRTWLVRV